MDAHGITELITTLSANGASGRLDIIAGGNEGALLFNSGKLVDARIGHLTGFQAINAIASMRDALFHFDPSVAVPNISSIRPSERLVLRQFFGIETADSQEHAAPAPAEVDEATLIKSSAASEVTHDRALIDETTILSEPSVIDAPVETDAIYQARPRVRYLMAFALGVLLIAVVAGAVLLREKFRERSSAATVAARTETVSPPAPAQPVVNEGPGVNNETRVTEEPRVTETPRVSEKPSADATSRVNETPRVDEEPRVNEKPRVTEQNETAAASTPDLTGDWTVVNTVANTSYRSFQNLRIGFALSINQTGSTFTAKGQKVSENGRSLPAKSRTPIELKGVINGDQIEAIFYEHGAMRKTNGRFVWKIDRKGGGLTGTFDSTAARTRGKSTATREL